MTLPCIVKRNITFFEDILFPFHYVVVKEIIMNGLITIPTFPHKKTRHAHVQDQNLNLLMFNKYSKSKMSLQGHYLTV